MPLTLQDWESIAVIATCIGGLAVWLWRSRFPTALATVVTNVDRVLHEVTPNGGSSLKDRVMKLEQSLELSYCVAPPIPAQVTTGVL